MLTVEIQFLMVTTKQYNGYYHTIFFFQNASIIVFPEYGLTGLGYTRDSFKPFLENIPDPQKVNWNACQDQEANSTTPILYRLSCLAKTYDMYLVVNMGDIKQCNNSIC